MNIINIKDKEFYLVAILIVMFFGISAATITGSAVRDAIFLIKYEKKIPATDVCNNSYGNDICD